MREIKLKTVILTNSQLQGFKFNYRNELLQVIEIIPQGITLPEMTIAIKVQTLLQKAKDDSTIKLDDSEWAWLCKRVMENQWRVIAPEIVTFAEEIKNARVIE